MNKLPLALQALESEDEVRLASILLWQCSRPKGLPRNLKLRFLVSWLKALATTLLRVFTAMAVPKIASDQPKQVAAYAVLQTQNQYDALLPCLNILSEHGVPVAINATSNVNLRDLAKPIIVTSTSLRSSEHLAVAVLLILRLPALMRMCLKSGCNSDRLLSLATVAYRTMLATIRLIEQHRPSLVLMANDHCPGPRAARLISEKMGIKSAYVQHACVSNRFPILAFDYAFLDGEIALRCYMGSTRDADSVYLKKKAERCIKYLVGQQKRVVKPCSRTKDDFVCRETYKPRVGIAISIPMNRGAIDSLVKSLSDLCYPLLIRTHPRQPQSDIAWLRELCNGNADARLVPASEMELADYLSQIRCLIAGNSSIHLEAAIAGCETYCYPLENIGPEVAGDYYGFLQNGLSTKIPLCITKRELRGMLESTPSKKRPVREIQRYSETFNTSLAGREGELLASIISEVIYGGASKVPIKGLSWIPDRAIVNMYRPMLSDRQLG